MRWAMASLLAGLITASCSVVGIRTTPEPAYTVQRRLGDVEVRDYGPRVVAETTVPAGAAAARDVGFRRLAGYIFGANATKATIAMTAPVAQSPGDGAQIRFFMPKDDGLADLPRPNDPSVRLAAIPGERVAVLRYSGVATERAVADAQARLLRAVAGAGLVADGAPFSWFYDPPWTFPPARRNEAVVKLAPAGG